MIALLSSFMNPCSIAITGVVFYHALQNATVSTRVVTRNGSSRESQTMVRPEVLAFP